MKTILNWMGWGGLVLVALGVVLYRWQLAGLMGAFSLLGIGALLAALAGTIALALQFVHHRFEGPLMLLFIVGWLPPVLVFATVGTAGLSAPAIHDISTDLVNPPRFRFAQHQRGEGDNSLDHGGELLAAQQREAYGDIGPYKVSEPPQVVLVAAVAVVQQMGWELLGVDNQAGQLEAVERTALFGFADDLVIRVSTIDGGSRVDMRSVSRVGRGDLGANAERIRRFYDQFCARVQSDLNASCTVLQEIEKSHKTSKKSVDSFSVGS